MAVTYQDLLPLKHQGDPLADEVVKELLDADRINSVNQLFRQISTADQTPPAECPPKLRDYFETTRRMPAWVEQSRLEDTAEFFRHHKLEAAALQATAGLVGTYLSPVGAKTLHSTHELDQPHRRLSQSTRLFMGMGDADAFTEHSKLIPTCQKVRLVHAAIRVLHERSGKWDHEQDGTPVSQYYTAGAALVFSAGILDSLKRIGIKNVSEREADGFVHAWRIIAHFLGVPDEMLPTSARHAHELWDAGRDIEWSSSDEGIILTAECIKLYQAHMPPGMKDAVPAFLRLALSDKYADMVNVPRSAYDFGANAVSSATSLFSSTPVGDNLVVKPVLGKLSEAVEAISRKAFTEGQETEPQMTDRITKK
ncbi:oxygenase MpaB family protein [Streptomyces sp. NPDC101150]|uniref:oxygenase MpaB family protein n=1 Tax=Streptomyces sp. NPDC101150 TaxID=3366114 RepID=UPI00380EE807